MPDLIGTNLAYATSAFEWRDFCPVSDDGVIVSGFEELEKADSPAGT